MNKNVPARKTSYAEKQDLITKLGIKVYPSDEGKVVRIACNVHPFTGTSRFSPQIISIASPILTIRREVRGAKAYLELLLSCQENDHSQACQEAVP